MSETKYSHLFLLVFSIWILNTTIKVTMGKYSLLTNILLLLLDVYKNYNYRVLELFLGPLLNGAKVPLRWLEICIFFWAQIEWWLEIGWGNHIVVLKSLQESNHISIVHCINCHNTPWLWVTTFSPSSLACF
jgi:hypothetical protein